MKKLNRQQAFAAVTVFLLIIASAGYRIMQDGVTKPELKVTRPAEQSQQPPKISVHVTGAVYNPGVYSLPKGSRVNDALKLAKVKKEACPDKLNLAEFLTDGQKIMVPQEELSQPQIASSQIDSTQTKPKNATSPAKENNTKVNLNSATAEQLLSLPGIGPALAQRILDYRQQKGGFNAVEDLKKVSGIGEKKFADLKDLVTI